MRHEALATPNAEDLVGGLEMGLFEQYPVLMVPFILAVVGVYDLCKWVIRRVLTTRGAEPHA